MRVFVVGSGGREHAIIKKLGESPKVSEIYAFPGNGGMAEDAVCIPGDGKNVDAIVAAVNACKPDFVVVAPDDPLVLGAVDALHAQGYPCFGPSKAAAAIEGSKVFSKNLMRKYGIPTADYQTFDSAGAALEYVKTCPIPVVVKADGLALGKGVLICMSRDEAIAAVHTIMEEHKFGESGSKVVIEEFLEGPEVSVLSFTDGKTVVPMVSSMDHKRARDNDEGLNTGGMGTIAPNPYYTADVAGECMEKIFIPTIKAMNSEGHPFKGCLYFGLMITKDGPKVIEYNCRFGDPETQVVLPLLESDLMEIMLAVEEERLADCPVRFSDGHACCVVLASDGYPEKYSTGYEITVDPDFGAMLYSAGIKLGEKGEKLSSGGRVLGVTATGKTLRQAVDNAYAQVGKVHFENAYCRSDIGGRALACQEERDG